MDAIGHPMLLLTLARLTTVEVLGKGRCAGVSSPLDRQMDLFTLSPLRLSVSTSINHAHYKCLHMGICRRHPGIVHVSLSKLRLPLAICRVQNFSSGQP